MSCTTGGADATSITAARERGRLVRRALANEVKDGNDNVPGRDGCHQDRSTAVHHRVRGTCRARNQHCREALALEGHLAATRELRQDDEQRPKAVLHRHSRRQKRCRCGAADIDVREHWCKPVLGKVDFQGRFDRRRKTVPPHLRDPPTVALLHILSRDDARRVALQHRVDGVALAAAAERRVEAGDAQARDVAGREQPLADVGVALRPREDEALHLRPGGGRPRRARCQCRCPACWSWCWSWQMGDCVEPLALDVPTNRTRIRWIIPRVAGRSDWLK